MKGAIPFDTLQPGALTDYARILGHLLAKGHARTSGASMIAGYVGSSRRLDDAMCRFGRAMPIRTKRITRRWSGRSRAASYQRRASGSSRVASLQKAIGLFDHPALRSPSVTARVGLDWSAVGSDVSS